MTAPALDLSPLGLAALEYAARGWSVFPLHSPEAASPGGCSCGRAACGNIGKHPRTRDGFKSATTDTAQIVAWWSEAPRANIGIATGLVSGLLVLDIDPRNGGDLTFEHLVQEVGEIPDEVHALTGGGGRHLLFRYPSSTASFRARPVGSGIDVKGDGGYIVAPPSLHASGRSYAWEASSHPDDNELPEIPPRLLARLGLRVASPTSHAPGVGSAGETLIGRAFAHAGLVVRPLDGGKLAVACPWNHEHTTGEPGDSSTVLFPARAGASLGGFLCSHGHCAGRTWKDALDALPPDAVARAKAEMPPPSLAAGAMGASSSSSSLNVSAPNAPPTAGSPPQAWRAELLRNTQGNVIACVSNLAMILHFHPDWQGLAYDEFSAIVVHRARPPWHAAFQPRSTLAGNAAWVDADAVRMSDWFGRHEGLRASPEACAVAADTAARTRPFHPVREYLLSLAWDGVDRAHAWLATYLGVEDSAYSQDVARTFLISAVARILRPGCKVDTMLVIEGEQGARKSTVIKALFGEEYVNDTTIDLHSKDRFQALAGKWAIEHAELDGLSRSDAERVKAFCSSPVDRFRPPFGRVEVVQPRQCVFVGTTNRDEYLDDETGARRFLPVRARTINVEGLAAARDQLWAEAIARYYAGEQWWPSVELSSDYRSHQEQRRKSDPWHEPVAKYVEHRDEVTMVDLLGTAIGKEKALWSTGDYQRAGKIMRALGWTVGRATTGTRERIYRRGAAPDPA